MSQPDIESYILVYHSITDEFKNSLESLDKLFLNGALTISPKGNNKESVVGIGRWLDCNDAFLLTENQ